MGEPAARGPAPDRPFAGRTILLGVSGSIAVIKAPVLVRLLTDRGARVQVALSAAAAEFVPARTFAALTADPVLTDRSLEDGLAGLRSDAIAYLVAPASARTLGDLAGDGPGLLAEVARRVAAPLWIAPAMESRMYGHPATRANVARLTARGARFIGPAAGRLASGATGLGRLVEPEEIVAELVAGLGV